jgi:hypothetical protein
MLPKVYKRGQCWIVIWHTSDCLFHIGSCSLPKALVGFVRAVRLHRRVRHQS